MGIVANPELEDIEPLVRELIDIIGDWAEVVLEENIAKRLEMPGLPLEDMNVEVMITIGGDGTILYVLQKCNPIIAGINAGQLGFLTEIPRDNLKLLISRILDDEYEVETRLRLQIILNGGMVHF